MTGQRLFVGLDVGSTTVKAIVVDPQTDQILWQDYQRHETKQPEKTLEFLQRIEKEFQLPADHFRIFITGSGGGGIVPLIGAKFVQEVNAVSLAVEKLHPEVGSVIELGGQDAKIIIFKEDPETGRKKKIPSMNDKCAGGTGAVIDKINAKLRIPAEELCNQGYYGLKLHPVAGKCGVFAETDINSLQKMGVPKDELMASLFEAIVGQNLAVLTRGNTLRPVVLLLGGPNTYVRGMTEAWKHNIPKIWEERNYPLPEGVDPQDLIAVPKNAQYFAAIGAVEFGRQEEPGIGIYKGTADLEYYINFGRLEEKKKKGAAGLSKSADELQVFKERYKRERFVPATFQPGEVVEAFVGLDGGSTSTKAVILNKDRNVLVKTYQLSKGNPIEDTIEVFGKLRQQVEDQGAALKILGVGTTGYAKDILKDVLGADVALVETVAHTESALRFYKDVDVICDVGGQDIKLMILKNRQVKDFKLNTQCSAGNGYFLQGTAEGFGFKVEEFADQAFSAEAMPTFGYGCAVFMQSDIVDFQRQGWKPEEIMAGLAAVLPKNIWLYVSQIPNLSALGTNFILQGGTQNNLAAVKAQVDFIESRFKGKGIKPNVIVHEHCGESGAIGAAIEAVRLWENGRQTIFIGIDAVEQITYQTHRNENTRCYFCKNKCLRTFIDVKVNVKVQTEEEPVHYKSKIPLESGTKRLIVGNSCEKGLVEDVEAMRVIKKGLDAVKGSNPNLVEIAARAAFKSFNPTNVAEPPPRLAITKKQRGRVELMKRREQVRIGMPRALNMYSQTPVFSAYFEALGIKPENLVYSDYTSEQLYKEGAKRGAIDPCFPSKVGIPHVHNLLYVHHKKKPLDIIFFPMIDSLTTDLYGTQDSRACPTVTTTPEAVKAAFIKEGDLFEQLGVKYFPTFVKLAEPQLFARQMYEQFKDILGLSEEENARATEEGYSALDYFNNVILRGTAREVLNQLVAEQRLGIVLLARPYHHDPGINHEILEEFQKQGYPVFAQDSLPIDPDILDQLFGDEVRAGIIRDPMDVSDAWKNSYSENTSRKIWAAKYVARHPNLVALELSSFKCGHDAPIYSVVEEIVENSGTPYFCFKDIDENKPTGSIKIRVETISYFLKRYREDMVAKKTRQLTIEERMRAYERRLREELYQKYAEAGIGSELVGVGGCGHTESGAQLLQLTEV
jgi:activator of 2-hydroxyglutaryl-CoA dehydratase/predicted nucleotide-binding protein (sugar kinase/HSP70/actin superfamily)